MLRVQLRGIVARIGQRQPIIVIIVIGLSCLISAIAPVTQILTAQVDTRWGPVNGLMRAAPPKCVMSPVLAQFHHIMENLAIQTLMDREFERRSVSAFVIY